MTPMSNYPAMVIRLWPSLDYNDETINGGFLQLPSDQ